MLAVFLMVAWTTPSLPPSDPPGSCLRIEENLYLKAALGEAGASEHYLDSLLSCGGGGPEVLLSVAAFHYDQGAYKRSQKVLDQLLAMPDLSAKVIGEAEYSSALDHYMQEQYEAAIAHARKALTQGFTPAWAYNVIGLCHERMKDPVQGEQAFEQAAAADPGYARSYGNLAFFQTLRRRHDLAVVNFRIADSLANHTVGAYAIGLTRAARDLDQEDLEAFYAERAHRYFPDDRDAILDLANVRDKQHRYAEIRPLLNKLLELRPSDYDDLFGIAKAYNSLGQLDSSIYYYRHAIRADEKRSGPSRHNLGLMYADLGLFEEAHEQFDRALELDPDNYRIYMAKADAYNWQFDFERALEWTLEYDRRLPNGRRNGLGIGYSLMQLGRYPEAIPYLEDALRRAPNDDRALNNLGRCHAQLGDLPRAKTYFDRALAAEPNNSFIYHNRAAYHLQLGDTANACADLRKALELDYNWIIDSALINMARVACPDIPLERRILVHDYRGNVKELGDRPFIERYSKDQLLAPLGEIPMDTTAKAAATILSSGDEMLIAPNPASNEAVVLLGADMMDANLILKLFDGKGAAVLSQRISATRTALDVHALIPGTYVVMLSDERSVRTTGRLVIAH